jgi:tetratricopeptide (TPR) repeat protein
VLQVVFLSSVFVLALIKIEDLDVWIHLSFGRLIWNLKGLPATEPFLYTMQGQPFSYSSWLFGLIYYATYHVFNVYGVILLKAITITTALYILLRDSLRPFRNIVVSVFVLSLIVIMIRYRFVERPDTFMMVFLAFSIFSLNAFIYDGKKYLFVLPFVHMLWANSHSSITLMFVPFMAFIVGGFLQRYAATISPRFVNVPSFSQLKTITLVFISSFAASLISPYFVGQYFFGTQFLSSSDWYSQNIAELGPPSWQTMKWPFIIAPAALISFLLNRKHISLIHVLLIIPFIVLSFIAGRFVFLPCIVAGPIIARNISASLSERALWENFFSKTIVFAGTLVWIVLSVTLVFARIEPFVDTRVVDAKIFGFGINYDCYPEKALRYMDKRNISGRVFNNFGWGQYIIWRDYPMRMPFVDGRGYLRPDLLEIMDQARFQPEMLDVLYNTYGFESVIINYPSPESAILNFGNNSALSHPGWALVYWDDLSLVYLKKGGQYDSVIKEDEYRFINPANSIASIRLMLDSEGSRTQLIGELQRNIAESGSSKAYAFLGSIYNGMGSYQQAIEAFSHVRSYPTIQDHLFDRYTGTGYAYSQLGKLDDALRIYKESAKLTKVPDFIYFNIGNIYFRKNDKKNALKYLEKAIKMNSTIASAYPLLISLYHDLNRTDDAKRMEERYRSVLLVKSSEEHDSLGRIAFASGRMNVAIDEFKRAIEINPSNPAAYSNLGRVYFNSGVMNQAYEYQQKALEIDPNYAMAYYWLGHIYRNSGNAPMARRCFEEYRRIEPDGYLSRKAKQFIKELAGS